MLEALVKIMPLEDVYHLFTLHRDPNIIPSLGLWDPILDDIKLYIRALFALIRSFQCL